MAKASLKKIINLGGTFFSSKEAAATHFRKFHDARAVLRILRAIDPASIVQSSSLQNRKEPPVVSTLDAALHYADTYGWACFPLQPREKKPLPGSHGFKDASKDRVILKDFWRRHPDANVGIATGAVSGLSVLDIDPKNGGDLVFQALAKKHGALPATITVATGGGGLQFYFADAGIGITAAKIGRGIDTRGNGGYVVAPPSIHPSGTAYAFLYSPEQAKPAIMPAWLLELLPSRSKEEERRVSDEERTQRRSEIRELFARGSRQGAQAHDLAKMAGYLFRTNLPPLFAREILYLWVQHRFESGIDDGVRTIIDNIAKRENDRMQRRRGGNGS